jgi:tape measure domain-containing protein
MALKVGDLVFNVRAHTGALQTDVVKAKAILQEVKTIEFAPSQGLLAGMGITPSGLALVTSMTAGITALATAAGSWAIKLAASQQDAEASFKVLLGDAKKAKAMLEELKDFASKTPFTFSSMQANAQLLMAYGLNAQQILPTVKALGDVAQGNQEKFSRLATAFGQVVAKGRLMGQEAMQMREAAFNPLEFIAKRTGETMGELEKRMETGGITIREVALAFQDATTAGERYFNSMDEASKTLNGQLSTLLDNVEELGRNAGGVALPALSNATGDLNELIYVTTESVKKLREEYGETTAMAELAVKQLGLTFLDKNTAGVWRMLPTMKGISDFLKEQLGIADKPSKDIEKMGEVFAELPKNLNLSKQEIDSLKDTLDDFDEALKARAKEREKLASDAAKIFEQTRTPVERLAMDIAEAQKLFAEGWLSSDTFNRELERLRGELAGLSNDAINGVSAKSQFSAEAFSTIERDRRRSIVEDDAKEQIRVLREMAATLKEIAAKPTEKTPVKTVRGRF